MSEIILNFICNICRRDWMETIPEPTGWDGREQVYSRTCKDCEKTLLENRVKSYITKDIGARFTDAKITDFGPDFAIQIAELVDVSVAKRQGFHITGVENAGKTHLVAALIRYLAIKHLKPEQVFSLYLRGRDIYRLVDYRGQPCDTDTYEKYVSSPVLFIDDMVTADQRAGDQILGLVDDRYRRRKYTISVSNFPVKQIYEGGTPIGETVGRLLISRIVRDAGDEGTNEIVLEPIKR